MAKYAFSLKASGAANRWNKENEYVIYCAESRALAVLELVVHRNSIMNRATYKLMTITLPDEKKYYEEINPGKLSQNWKSIANYANLQKKGSDWYVKQISLVLKVPSVLVRGEYNYIINTRHPDFDKVILKDTEDYHWDKRLL
ncbi:RES family NAD+ phosphorylase [Sinomicrobium sp. M5D2P17]